MCQTPPEQRQCKLCHKLGHTSFTCAMYRSHWVPLQKPASSHPPNPRPLLITAAQRGALKLSYSAIVATGAPQTAAATQPASLPALPLQSAAHFPPLQPTAGPPVSPPPPSASRPAPPLAASAPPGQSSPSSAIDLPALAATVNSLVELMKELVPALRQINAMTAEMAQLRAESSQLRAESSQLNQRFQLMQDAHAGLLKQAAIALPQQQPTPRPAAGLYSTAAAMEMDSSADHQQQTQQRAPSSSSSAAIAPAAAQLHEARPYSISSYGSGNINVGPVTHGLAAPAPPAPHPLSAHQPAGLLAQQPASPPTYQQQ